MAVPNAGGSRSSETGWSGISVKGGWWLIEYKVHYPPASPESNGRGGRACNKLTPGAYSRRPHGFRFEIVNSPDVNRPSAGGTKQFPSNRAADVNAKRSGTTRKWSLSLKLDSVPEIVTTYARFLDAIPREYRGFRFFKGCDKRGIVNNVRVRSEIRKRGFSACDTCVK